MSLSGALSNALSGLNANALGTSVISSNIANALNEHYGARSVQFSANATQSSGGVRVEGVARYDDPVLAHQKRLAKAALGEAEVQTNAAKRMEELWGSVDTVGSVAEKLTAFETALSSAATDPSSEVRLRNVAYAAESFSASIRSASDGIQNIRQDADSAIGRIVTELNAGLQNLEDLNGKVILAKHTGGQTLGLLDQRAEILDKLSGFIPLHVIERESGAIAVFSKGGQTLLDVSAVEFSFEETRNIQPHMTVSGGLLSQLSINGNDVDASSNGFLSGGTLAAQFDTRDNFGTEAQGTLDAIARDVIERFGPTGPDTTLGLADPGVFTDGGSAFAAANEIGLAGRIQLNTALTNGTSEIWRWRDGLGAVSQGEVGNNSLLIALNVQITANYAPTSPALSPGATSLVAHVHELSNRVSAERLRAEDKYAISENQFAASRNAVASHGVNSDEELQKLIELEKSFAANARVVQVVDDMLSELLRV